MMNVWVADEWNDSENVRNADQQASCYMPLAPVVMQSKQSGMHSIWINTTLALSYAYAGGKRNCVCVYLYALMCSYLWHAASESKAKNW